MQTMWTFYRRARKDEDYTHYKEALNAVTSEIRKCNIIYGQTLACSMTNYRQSFFYAYVRGKQNV